MHYGWVIVAAGMVVGACGYGTYYAFTLFYTEMVAEFGWSRTAVSGAMSLGMMAYGFFGLPMGWCVDRFGPRGTVLVGGLLFGTGTALGSCIEELWHLYVLYGGITAAGMGAAWAPLVATVSRWFEAKRGLAVGITVLGGSIGIFLIAPLAEALIATRGWRDAYLWLGLISGGLMAGSALLLDRDPANRGLRPYGAQNAVASLAVASVKAAGSPPPGGLGAIARRFLFWHMSLAFGLWWFAGAIVYIQIAPFLLEKGFGSGFAALALMLFGVGNCAGRIVMGLLSDWVGGACAYRLSMLIAAVAMSGCALAEGQSWLLAATFVVGFGFGGALPQLTTIGSDLFGTVAIGTLMGAVLALVGLIGAAGPLVSGLIYDAVQSYTPAFHLGAAVFLLSLFLSFGLRR
ncbi:MAG: MFS transporter [Pseudomonadota bacterium]|nr:MFS transporter [Pseudomonadota bacterium]